LGLAQISHANANHLPPPIDVGRHRLIDVSADGSQPLSEFGCGDAIARQSLMIEPSQLLELARL
jgi:hypothetical protein